MEELIKKYNLKQKDLFTWENDKYLLSLNPNDVLLALLSYNCVISLPSMYPQFEDLINKYQDKLQKPKIIEKTDDYVLIELHTESFNEFIKQMDKL